MFPTTSEPVNERQQDEKWGKWSESKWTEPPLIGRTIYFLNKSFSKWVSVGLSPYSHFAPVVEIVGTKKQKAVFIEEEWKKFLFESQQLKKYVDDNVLIPTIKLSGVKISSEYIDGVRNVLKVQKDGDVLFISYEGMKELWDLENLIEARLTYLQTLNFRKYYREVAEYVEKAEGAEEAEIRMLLEGPVSEHLCILKEFMVYNPNALMSFVDLLQKIRACVEK